MAHNFEDLSNTYEGDIHIIKYIGNKYWECKCKCGKELRIRKSCFTRNYKNYVCKHTEAISIAHNNPMFIDLTDGEFGDLKVIKYNGSSKWLLRCKCGKEIVAESKYIRSHYNNFICNHKDLNRSKNFIDITGKSFGEYTVVKYIGNRVWKCMCKCGIERNIHSYSLRNRGYSYKCSHISRANEVGTKVGDITLIQYNKGTWECKCKCGNKVYRSLKYIKSNGDNYTCSHLTGKRFGKLTVGFKDRDRYYRCTCDCGKELLVLDYNLLQGNSTSCGCSKNKKLLSEEEVISIVSNYVAATGRKIKAGELYKILGVSYSTSINYINKLNLDKYIETKFRSYAEIEIYESLREYNNVVHNKIGIIPSKELDIYIPDKKVAIEFNGDYWHSTKYKNKRYHQEKTIECAKRGIRLIHIFEHEWKNVNTRNKIMNILNSISNPDIRYARKFIVSEESYSEEIKDFLNNNHLSGYSNSSIHITLRDKENKEICGILTFGKPRFNNEYEYEIIRSCFKSNIIIVGGLEKMFKLFVDKYKPKSILTYVDISKFSGNSYIRLGFRGCGNDMSNITEPGYNWIDTINNTKLSRYQCQKHKLISKNLGTIDQTEDEIMERLGYLKVYNCGNLRLIWNKDQ